MKARSRLISLALALSLVFSLTACGSDPSGDPPSTDPVDSGTHVIVDHLGVEVTVPNTVERIAVCNIVPLPSVLAIFFDSADKIVGMSDTSMSAAENGLLGEIYPEILEAETGFIDGSTVNVEELMKLRPDVVFYNAATKDLGEQLRNAGFAAVGVSVNKWEYDSIETLNHWISLLGDIFPDNDKSQVVEDYSKQVYDRVQQRVSGLSDDQRQRVFFLYKYSDTVLQTSGQKFFGQWWAEAIGAINVAEELTTDNAVTVNMEQVYGWNPSLIFITNFTPSGPEDLVNNTVGNYNWSPVDAVLNGQVYKMPLGMYRSYTPGVDTPVTLLWLAKTAYPDLFADIDITQETKNYYQQVFGITLTDDQANSIFAPTADAGKGF